MMSNRKRAAYLCAAIVLLMTAGCGSSDADSDVSTVDTINYNDVSDVGAEENNSNDQNMEEDIDNQQNSDTEEQNTTETPKVREAQEAEISAYEQQQAQKQAESHSDEELEEKLAAYRQAREEKKPIDLGNGVTMGASVNEAEYGIAFDASILRSFDTGELMEAIDTANSYVENTLGISVETRDTTYMCVDPRIWAIYSAEDKGVANGYEPENIYVCEYCDNGTWQYLILVREGKGSSWKVIHHGSSYMVEGEE